MSGWGENSKPGMRPWPTNYLCPDGVRRNLNEYIATQWDGKICIWHARRADIARSLGRPVLPEISGMTRIGKPYLVWRKDHDNDD